MGVTLKVAMRDRGRRDTDPAAQIAAGDAMRNARLENMPLELQQAYRKVAPHPENFRTFHDKAAQRMRDFKDVPNNAIRGITASTLVIVGDADVVRPEHAVELFRLLPHAKLAVLPGTDHMAMMKRTGRLNPSAPPTPAAPHPVAASPARSRHACARVAHGRARFLPGAHDR